MKVLLFFLLFLPIHLLAQKASDSMELTEKFIYDNFFQFYYEERCSCKIPATDLYFDSIQIDSTQKIIEYEWFLSAIYKNALVKKHLDSNDLAFFRTQILNPIITSWDQTKVHCKLWRKEKKKCSPNLSVPLFSIDRKKALYYSNSLSKWYFYVWNTDKEIWEMILCKSLGS